MVIESSSDEIVEQDQQEGQDQDVGEEQQQQQQQVGEGIEEEEGEEEEEEEEEGVQEEGSLEEAADLLVEEANELLETKLSKEQHLEASEVEELLLQFEKALTLDPKNIEAQLGKAYLYGLQENYSQGKAVLEGALLEAPEDGRIIEMLTELRYTEEEGSKEELQGEEGNKDIPLLVEGGIMTKGFYEALVKVFRFFDEDGDKVWNEKELAKYYETVNGEKLPQEVIHFLRTHFETNSEGSLTLEGFLNFYLSQTAGDATETWKDLQRLGFDEQLQDTHNKYKEC